MTSISKRGLHQKTLSSYYPQINTLLDYLDGFKGSVRLIVDNDPHCYIELLRTAICASQHDVKAMSPAWTPLICSQQEAIDRTLLEAGRLLSKAGLARNVLLSGNRAYEAELPINTSRPGIENRHANSPSSVLRSLPWRILRSRLGEAGFRHLILNTSLFLPVGNNCYTQLSGLPIYDLYDQAKQSLMLSAGVKRQRIPARTRSRKKSRLEEESSEAIAVGSRKVSTGPAQINVMRQRMFYGQPARRPNGTLFHGLPPQHLLNKSISSSSAVPDDRTCLNLLQAIFTNHFSSPTKIGSKRKRDEESELDVTTLKGGRERLQRMVGTARELIVRHHGTKYGTLLRRCLGRMKGLPNSPIQPVSHGQVCRYFTTILKRVFPASIMGSQHNSDVLARHARLFVKAKQFELTSLHSIIHDLKVNDFTWLVADSEGRTPPQEMLKRRTLVGELVLWIFDGFLVPLLKNSFHITETAMTRYETVYFSHEDWDNATKPHFAQLERTLLKELDSNQRYFALNGPLGVSAVRLIPKAEGFRPIVNLGRRIKQKNLIGIPVPGSAKAMTANQVLRGIHQVLTFEKDRKRDSLGASLFGTNEIFAPVQDLKRELGSLHNGDSPSLYFVKMDIKAAFDTIKQNKMLDIISRVLDKNHDYCLMLYCLLLPAASKASQGSARRIFKTRAMVNDGMSSAFGDQAKEISKPLRNAVVVDLMRRRHITRESCMDLLRQHIKQNVWQVGDRFFRQRTGIPQGSKISSLLCSFFYAALEAEHLSWVNQPGSKLLRYIDDFLLITSDYHLAKRFVERMNQGFPEYGAEVSRGKTLLSFEWSTGSQVAAVCGLDQMGRSYFPYCGFLIDTKTLEISMDYPRVLHSPVRQSFALRSNRHRGTLFVGWLSRQLENRNHVAYLDTAHNSIDAVHLNVFLNFALTAMKIPHYFFNDIITVRKAKLMFDSICLAAEYTYAAGRARVRHAARDDRGREHYQVKKRDFTFLAVSAVMRVLEAKAARFGLVIASLKAHTRSRKFRRMEQGFAGVIERGWNAVRHADY